MYGSQYVSYGTSKNCPRCARVHLPREGIEETSASRFKLLQLMGELVYARKHQYAGVDQADRMFGVLITPAAIYAAHSGQLHNGFTPFLIAARGRGYTTCDERGPNFPGLLDVRFRPITPDLYKGTKRGGGYPPGACAAPRLIQQAILDHQRRNQRIDLTRWAMSEVMYKSDPTRSPASGQDWVHGLTAHSCETCARLVPLLLCTHEADWTHDFDTTAFTRMFK
ncbi:hypothetical protein AWB75_04661 [Caballeronia catudaia]|uniref:Uncharacterized protein n=1 Tax=Caballeronia catudaia TaxID=1777136 RepID=A0A158C7T5_9BURK|nr:hypothetical protein AWB75_04661 [Caballeronia catudaia]